MSLAPLPRVILEPLVRAALVEDLGLAGDLTTNAIVPPDAKTRALFVARKPGVVAGLDLAKLTFELVDPSLSFSVAKPDGSHVEAGETIASVSGKAAPILIGERVALNFLGHMSGIATATARFVEAVESHGAKIVCTRKTTPGLRVLEKYAVRCGGGLNHRFGLDDAVLIKDNHIVAAGGIKPAVERVRAGIAHMMKIELEVDTLEQLEQALALGVDTILLDNMPPDTLRKAVAMTNGRAALEASGNVTLATVRAIAETGVDYISSGAITHSASNLDLGLDF
jgi:nicotinate-nucleotide pyrophosphorylase (carboxylating)